MTTHYTVLGLPEQATLTDIKREYRRLVLLTHPDRTSDPAQHRLYLAINEAYETLSDPARRQRYDTSLRPPDVVPKPTVSQPAAAQRPPTRPPRRPPPLERQRGRLRTVLVPLKFDYGPYAPIARRLCRLLLLLTLLVFLDYLAPARSVEAELESIGNERNAAGMLRYVIGTSHGSFITATDVSDTARPLQLQISWLFRFVHEARLSNGQPMLLEHDFSSLLFFTVLLGLLAVAAQWPRLSAATVVNLSLLAAMVGLITLLMALSA